MIHPDYQAITDSEIRAGIRQCLCGELIVPADGDATMCSWCEQFYAEQADDSMPPFEPEFPEGVYWND